MHVKTSVPSSGTNASLRWLPALQAVFGEQRLALLQDGGIRLLGSKAETAGGWTHGGCILPHRRFGDENGLVQALHMPLRLLHKCITDNWNRQRFPTTLGTNTWRTHAELLRKTRHWVVRRICHKGARRRGVSTCAIRIAPRNHLNYNHTV